MAFEYTPPKKKKNNIDLKKIINTVQLLVPFPTIAKGKYALKQYKKLKTQRKAAKIGQTIGPAGGPTSITKNKKPKFQRPIIKESPQYEHPIWRGPFPFKRKP